MSLNLEPLERVADTLGSSLRSGDGGGGKVGEMLREADGWRDDELPASPDGFVSLAGGWLRRRVFFPFFGGGVSIRYSLLPLSSFNRPLLHSQIQPDRVLPAGLLGAGKPEPRCEITVAVSPRSRPRFPSQGHDAQTVGVRLARPPCGP